MKTTFISLAISCLLLHCKAYAQEFPTEYFNKPMDIPFVLSGTFGELRNNHFHAGLDIKTQGRIGVPVKASASGYVSRIKVQEYGYGKVIYLKHPNGYETVYAHLSSFSDKIEAYVKKQQYFKESYEIELFPNAELFPIAQDEVIAFSGNTGSSGGPHLHFEIRNASSEPQNPLLFGFEEISDQIKPRVKGVWAYTLNDSAQIQGLQGQKRLQLQWVEDGLYHAEPIQAFGEIGVGVSTDDQLDFAINRNGIYKIQSFLNGNLHFEQRFESFSFAETRYINNLLDYYHYKEHNQRIQKLFIDENHPISINKFHNNGGRLIINEDGFHFNYQINIEDFAGNTQKILIPIEGKKDSITQPKPKKVSPYFVQKQYGITFEDKNVDIYIPKEALYDDLFLDIEFETNAVDLHDYRTPIHKSIHVGFDISSSPPEVQQKMYIARVMPWGTKYYTNTQRKKDRLVALTKEFGRYEVALDQDDPIITPVNVQNKKWMSNYRYLRIKIEDKTSGIANYRATVNDEFILMEYEYKDKELIYDFNDGKFQDGKNDFKLIVTDNVGNTSIFEAEIFRKN